MSDSQSQSRIESLLKKKGWAELRLKRVKRNWEVHGTLAEERRETWKAFAQANKLTSRVKFQNPNQISKLVTFEKDELARMERIAAHLGLSFSSYLRLAERRCSAQILRVWEEIIDWRAKEFVVRAAGIETKRRSVQQNKGLKFVKARLETLRATYADAEVAVFPNKLQRSEWHLQSSEGNSHEQWVAANLLDPRDDYQEMAVKALRGPLTEYFCAAVDRHRLAWLDLTRAQLRVEEKYVGGNRKLAEEFRRDLAFAEEALRLLDQDQPMGYRRFRQWGSQAPSQRHPQGRGYVRWQVEKKAEIGGDGFYFELQQCPKPRLPHILRHQLEAWCDFCRQHLKNLEKWQRADEERLNKLKDDPKLWYDVHHLERLLTQDHGKPTSITRRLPERLPEMELREEAQRL